MQDDNWQRDAAKVLNALAEHEAKPQVQCSALLSGARQKGEKHGECNRTVCRNQDALWFNSSTRKYYCQPCARKIMSWPENVGLLVKEAPDNDKLRDGATERRPSSPET